MGDGEAADNVLHVVVLRINVDPLVRIVVIVATIAVTRDLVSGAIISIIIVVVSGIIAVNR